MKSEIPPKKTKAYWEKILPNLQRQKEKVYLKKSIIFVVITSFVYFAVLGMRFGIDFDMNFKAWFPICIIWPVLSSGVILIHFLRRYLHKKKNGGTEPTLEKEMFLRNTCEAWGGNVSGGEPQDSPINTFFPKDMVVSELQIFFRFPKQSLIWPDILDQHLLCICTPEKHQYIDTLIHMKEGLTLRKESRRFKVTYKKYSKELVRIDLCDDETYPAHCGYEELTERINIMF